MEIQAALQNIGLNRRQVSIYLASLKHGPMSVLALANETGLHRPMLYKLLADMSNKGIFTTTVAGKRKLYVAVEPNQLLAYVKAKENSLKEVLPELQALSNIGRTKPKVFYFEGRERLQALYRTCLEARSPEILTYFPSRYMAELFGKREMVEVINERIQRGIHTKTLRSPASEISFEGSDQRQEALREVRYLDASQDPGMGIIIFDTTVNIFSPIEEDFGMQIQSPSYAQLMRCFFLNLWEKSTPA